MTTLFRRTVGGLRALFRRTRVERELDAELRGFLDASVDAKVQRGMPREEAMRAARIELGSPAAVKERVRDVGWESVVESVWQDVRYGGRMLRRSPGFAATAIGILALGIGANTAIFSLLNTVVLRTLPVRDPGQLVELLSRYPGEPHMNGFSWEFYEYVRDHNHVFSNLIGAAPAKLEVRVAGADTETVTGWYAVGDFFPALGLEPALGRLIGPNDARPDASPVAVVSWLYWKNRFSGDPAILGKQLMINGVPSSVIGVTPRAFSGVQTGVMPAIWLPVTKPTGLYLMARLKPGISIEQAHAEMSVLHKFSTDELAKRDPQWLKAKMDVESAAAGLSVLRYRFGAPLQLLMGVVALLLLIACTNIASMLLARGAARQREMAVRVSIGAGPLRLARQVLTESLLLSVAGTAIGVLLAYFGADALVRLMMSGRTPPRWPDHLELQRSPDALVLLFTAGVALATGVLFGLAPAWSAFRSAPISSLRETGTVSDKKSLRLFGRSLVVAQVALSVVLLGAAALFLGHLSNLRNLDLGFRRDSVLLVTLNPQGSGYSRVQLTHLYQDLLARLQAIPGVRSATLAGVFPIDGGAASRFASVDGFQESRENHRRVNLNWVAPKYFETLGTVLVAGREFQFDDATRPRVAIVNEAMARYYFASGGSPLGRHLTLEGEAAPYEIVGVVGDAKYADLHEAAPRTVYVNAFQDGGIQSRFALRTAVPPSKIAPAVRAVVHGALPTVAIGKVTTLADQLDASLVIERVIATLSGVFGALGALVAAIGLYGLLAYTVARRTSEIGVRMALGATEGDVTRMVLKGALGLVCAGLLVGAPISFWFQRLLASMMQGLPAASPLRAISSGLAMIGVALVAAYLPARRAARVNPIEALRHP